MDASVNASGGAGMRHLAAVLAGVAAVVLAAGCSSAPRASHPLVPAPTGSLRLGYTTDLADAPALVGLQMGFLDADLGAVTLHAMPFTSPAGEAQALLRGQLDVAYLDPVTALAVWQQGHGIKIVSGVASGGAELVVKDGITTPAQLAHAVVAAPPASAQQAALDWWLKENGIHATRQGNSTLTSAYLASALRSGRVVAAWEPAPADAELVAAGGKVMVNEAALWPGGQFSTAVLVVTSKFLAAYPAAITLLLRGQVRSEQFLATDRAAAERAFNARLATVQGPSLAPAVLEQSFAQTGFTSDPLAASIVTEGQHAAEAGLIAPVSGLASLFDLTLLNAIRATDGQPQIGT
jgi:NitT/TauT family transport system substrate-binding protein